MCIYSSPSGAIRLPAVPQSYFSLQGRLVRLAGVERVCERCGGADDDLVAVRPMEDRSDSWEEPLELWCFSCRSELPAETAE